LLELKAESVELMYELTKQESSLAMVMTYLPAVGEPWQRARYEYDYDHGFGACCHIQRCFQVLANASHVITLARTCPARDTVRDNDSVE
jgi:hypothetical protein